MLKSHELNLERGSYGLISIADRRYFCSIAIISFNLSQLEALKNVFVLNSESFAKTLR